MGKTSTNGLLLNDVGPPAVPFTLAKFTNSETIGVVEIGIDASGMIEELLEIASTTDEIVTRVFRIHRNGFGDASIIHSKTVKLAEHLRNVAGIAEWRDPRGTQRGDS
jgi:UDP-N-acetylmuramyl pentapeptide synthase